MHYGEPANFPSSGVAEGNNSLEPGAELIWGNIFYAKKV